MNPLVGLAIQELPDIIARLRELFHKDHLGDPSPTDAEVMAAYQSAYESSLARDAEWLRQHPE